MKQSLKKLYPLKFVPLFRNSSWGGSRFFKKYGKDLPRDEEGNLIGEIDPHRVGESFELADIPGFESVVAEGFLAENTLNDLLETYMGDLVGDAIFDYYNLQFPLVVKMIDAEDFMPVQSHPDDAVAFERWFSYGKDKLWYVMEADEDSLIYMGFKRPVSAGEFYDKCRLGTIVDDMNEYHPRKGDCFFIKAGTVHCAGGGVVIVEIHQPSDITFNLCERGTGCSDTAPLEESIDCVDFGIYDDAAYFKCADRGVRNVAQCTHFSVSHLCLDAPQRIGTDNLDSCLVYFCTEGAASIQIEVEKERQVFEFKKGELMLVPASCDDFILSPAAVGTELLEIHVPQPEEEKDNYIS